MSRNRRGGRVATLDTLTSEFDKLLARWCLARLERPNLLLGWRGWLQSTP